MKSLSCQLYIHGKQSVSIHEKKIKSNKTKPNEMDRIVDPNIALTFHFYRIISEDASCMAVRGEMFLRIGMCHVRCIP